MTEKETATQFSSILDKVLVHLQNYVQCERQLTTGTQCFLAGEFIIYSIQRGKLADMMVGCQFHYKTIMQWFVKSGAHSITRIPLQPSQQDKRLSMDVVDQQMNDIADEVLTDA